MKRFFVFVTLLALLALSCSLPGINSAEEPTQEPSPPPATLPVPTVEAGIVHIIQPSVLPSERSGHAGDYDSSTTADKKRSAGGDRFTFGRFERPFNATTMDVYFPELDIIDTFVFEDDTWVYGMLVMRGADANGNLSGTYGVEFDMNRDGKGDVLLLADKPASQEWTTDGVRVYRDTNKDVGGLAAMFTDEKPVSGDGFETLVVNSGDGDDPDTAWVRISADNTILFAIKYTALLDDDDHRYMLNMWAGTDDLDPAIFDHNDAYTHEQAGAADSGLEYFYPVKEVSELDNSCRMSVGFQPRGDEPGLCPQAGPQQEACNLPPPPNGCPILGAFALVWDPNVCTCVVP